MLWSKPNLINCIRVNVYILTHRNCIFPSFTDSNRMFSSFHVELTRRYFLETCAVKCSFSLTHAWVLREGDVLIEVVSIRMQTQVSSVSTGITHAQAGRTEVVHIYSIQCCCTRLYLPGCLWCCTLESAWNTSAYTTCHLLDNRATLVLLVLFSSLLINC